MLEVWMNTVSDNWLLIAFVAPFLWAVMVIVDVYFIDRVYRDEYEGIIISGLFHILPWLLVPVGIIPFLSVSLDAALLAFSGGTLFLASLVFYFKMLFREDDGALSHALWNFDILVVPLFSWLLAGEKLTFGQYGGIVVAFVGAWLLALAARSEVKKMASSILAFVLGSIFFSSVSVVFMKMAYDRSEVFWSIYLLFCAGMIAAAVFFIFSLSPHPLKRAASISRLTKKYFIVFFLSELLGVIAIATSQRALSLSPSASFVNIVEGFTPIFIIILSALLVPCIIRYRKNEEEEKIYQRQFSYWPEKLAAAAILSLGVWMVS